MSATAGRLSDRLIRLVGADPEVFRPLYRVQKLLLQRGVRVVQTRRKGLLSNTSAFWLLCFYALVYGLSSTALLFSAKSMLLGAATGLTLGCAFLLLVVITDNFDVLVNPREALILAAHPHDDRSFLFAKLAAIIRTLAILGLLLFAPPGIAAGFLARSAAASFAFFLGAASAGLTAMLFGMLLAALLLRIWGRTGMERVLPWIQGAFQIGYLVVIGGQGFLRTISASGPAALGLLPWLLPTFWFTAPLELVTAGPSGSALARLALAVAAIGLLLGVAVRWLGSGLTERLLEPAQPSSAAAARARRARRTPRPRRADSERARLFALLRVQLRSDWRTRSEFVLIPLMGAFLLLFYFPTTGSSRLGPLLSYYLYGWFLLLSADVLTRSSRPESLWWILTAPIDRARFSLSSLSLIRTFQLAPLLAAAILSQVRAKVPLPLLLATGVELLALGDLLVLLGKGIFPEFPFSQARSDGGTSAQRTVLTLVAGTVSGLFTAGLYFFGLWGPVGALAGAAVFFLLRFPAAFWARRRAAAAANGLEIGAAAAG